MPRLFLFPFWILGSPLAHPGFHAPAVARKFCAVFRTSKSTKPYAQKQSTPCLALLFTSGKKRPCVAWEQGHSEPWTPGSTAPQHRAAQGHSGGRGGAAAGQRKKIPKETPEVNTMVAWTRASPPKPITSRHRVVFSPLYLFTDKGAPRNHARCAFVLEREGLPPPRPRRRYYPARRMMRGEEGPKIFRLKTKKILAFRYANPIQTPHRR